MKKFKFQSNDITVEIEGAKLTCDAAEAEAEISMARNDLAEFSEKIMAGKADKKEIEEHIAFTLDKIDSAFGKGSSKSIFKDRAVSLHDCVDVVAYLTACFNEFENDKKELYGSFSGSREERRARDKK